MPSSTNLKKLTINKLTKAQYDELVNNNQINPNELYMITDKNGTEGKEDITNKVTTINSNNTHTQYPSAKAVYDSQQAQDVNFQSQIDAITSASDVVDVVGTYSELQNYDTSGLTDDDVIKVLQDSTHNDALSFYRWTIENNTGTWNYIGSEGPFYTKSETNVLLNAKQDEITSLDKLASDLVDDTNSGNKFVTSTEKNTWNAKYDKPSSGIPKTDLASGVQTSLDKADTAVQSLQNITWSELKQLRDNNQLLIGRQYRITDYVTTTSTANTNSAGHRFDLIVEAIGTGELSEQVQAIENINETYYANRNLGAWEVRYCLDNNLTRFAWADTTNGKGVIYYLKDEHNNRCGYDHTNIRYKGSSLYGYSQIPSGKVNGDSYYYTFSKGTNDATNVNGACSQNTVEPIIQNNLLYLPIVCLIINGNKIVNNQILSGSNNITLVSQTDCNNNSFTANCYNNLIISTLTSITGNNFSVQCFNNVMKADNILQNMFAYVVYNNTITVTGSFSVNTFSQMVYNNTFTISNMFVYNNIKNQVNNLTITCSRMSWGNFERTSYINFNYEGYLSSFSSHNVNGTSDSNKLDITNSVLTTITTPKYMTTDATGNIVCTWKDDKGKETGIYKTGVTDTEWKNIAYTEEDTTNKVTIISSSSTDIQYPSAKAVNDFVQGNTSKVTIREW